MLLLKSFRVSLQQFPRHFLLEQVTLAPSEILKQNCKVKANCKTFMNFLFSAV